MLSTSLNQCCHCQLDGHFNVKLSGTKGEYVFEWCVRNWTNSLGPGRTIVTLAGDLALLRQTQTAPSLKVVQVAGQSHCQTSSAAMILMALVKLNAPCGIFEFVSAVAIFFSQMRSPRNGSLGVSHCNSGWKKRCKDCRRSPLPRRQTWQGTS